MKKAKEKDPNQISLFDSLVDELSEVTGKSFQIKNDEDVGSKNNKIPIKVDLSIDKICNEIGFMNLDEGDFKTVLNCAKQVYIGAGHASGKGKGEKAARTAVVSPFMKMPFSKALRVLIINTVSPDIEFEDIEAAAGLIENAAHPDANIIFGAFFCEEMEDEIRIDIIAAR